MMITKELTLDLDAFEPLCDAKVVFNGALDLLVMELSGHVEDLEVEAVLALGLLVANEPLVTMFVGRRVGLCSATKGSLK